MGPSPVGSNLGGRRALAALAFVLAPAGAAPAAASAPAPPAVVALAQRGLGRDFEATYKVSGQLAIFPGPNGRSSSPIKARPRSQAPLRASGAVWSFFLHAGEGYQLQWIEHGPRFDDCWTTRTQPGWHCGQGTYEPSNGFSMATLPYVPATVLADVTQVVEGAPAGQPAPDRDPGGQSRLRAAHLPDERKRGHSGLAREGHDQAPVLEHLLHRPWAGRRPAPVG